MRVFYCHFITPTLALTPCFFDPESQKPATPPSEPAPAKYQIRVATPGDVTQVATIIAESFHSQKGFWGWAFPFLRLGICEDIRHRIVSRVPHHVCLVAITTTPDATNQLVGAVELAVRFHDSWLQGAKSIAYVSNLAVDTQHRRHGVGSELLVSCEKFARDWGFGELYLHVLENNYQARQLYCKLGYQPQDESRHPFRYMGSRQILLYKYLGISRSI